MGAVLCLLSLVGSAAPVAADPGLDEVSAQLQQAREGLAVIEGRKAATLADVDRIERRRAGIEASLEALRAELAGAQAALDAAQAAVDQTVTARTTAEAALADTRRSLSSQRQVFTERTRASYMHGGLDVSAAVLQARNFSELAVSLKYVRAVLRSDRDRVTTIAGLQRLVERQVAELAALQAEQEAARAAAAGERDRVSALVARQEQLDAAAAAQERAHARALALIEADEHAYRSLVAALEAESVRIADELRRRAEQERAAAARREPSAARGAPGGTAAGSAPAAGATRLHWPAPGPQTSSFGWRTHPIFGTRRFHAGIDIGAGTGTPVSAAEAGTVVSAGSRGGYGNATVIDHGGGLATLYAHQSRIGVRPGERVGRGQVIGAVGSTGYSTGPHLHFEVRVDGTPVDPMRYY